MTTDLLTDVIPGIAQFGDGTVTIGTYAEGGDVHLALRDGIDFRHIVATGPSGSGKTILLESLLAGAEAAGIPAQMIHHNRGDASTIINDHREMVAQVPDGVHPLRLLLVDGLADLSGDEIDGLAEVARYARKANVALLVATQDVRLTGRGGPIIQQFVDPIVIEFGDDRSTPGSGAVNGYPFRAWWPGS
jgi:hypothetical protein